MNGTNVDAGSESQKQGMKAMEKGKQERSTKCSRTLKALSLSIAAINE